MYCRSIDCAGEPVFRQSGRTKGFTHIRHKHTARKRLGGCLLDGQRHTGRGDEQSIQVHATKTAAGDAETAFEVTSSREDFDVDLRVPSPSGDGKSSIELVLRHTAAVAHGKWFAVGRRHEELVEAMGLPVDTPATAPSGRVARLLARLPSLQSARGRLSLACSAFVSGAPGATCEIRRVPAPKLSER